MSLDFYLQKYVLCDVYQRNITHNLGKMASEAGIYDCLWRPDENGYIKASNITKKLRKGLADLKKRPEHYKQFNPSNGWGDYYSFVAFVENILKACEENKTARIRVSR